MHKLYLLRRDGVVVERPQFLFMRVAVAIHGIDLVRVLQTYELLSSRAYTHATPTLFNAGTNSQYLASCFLYQPPVVGPLAVLSRSVTELSALWTVDGGVGMSLGCVPAREFVSSHSASAPIADLPVARPCSRILRGRFPFWRLSTSTPAYTR